MSIAAAHAAKVEGDPQLSREVEHRVHRAVHDHLMEMIPDSAVVATLDEADVPKVVAVHGDHFYEVEVGEIPDGHDPVPTVLRMRTIDPQNAAVDCEVRFSGHRKDDRQVICDISWAFRVGDLDLMFETHIDRRRDMVEPDEKFALSLAQAIGWEAPGNAVPLVAVA